MVGFEKTLLSERYEPWAPYYINYTRLKQILHELQRLSELGVEDDTSASLLSFQNSTTSTKGEVRSRGQSVSSTSQIHQHINLNSTPKHHRNSLLSSLSPTSTTFSNNGDISTQLQNLTRTFPSKDKQIQNEDLNDISSSQNINNNFNFTKRKRINNLISPTKKRSSWENANLSTTLKSDTCIDVSISDFSQYRVLAQKQDEDGYSIKSSKDQESSVYMDTEIEKEVWKYSTQSKDTKDPKGEKIITKLNFKRAFTNPLAIEMEKVMLFFLKIQGDIAEGVLNLRKELIEINHSLQGNDGDDFQNNYLMEEGNSGILSNEKTITFQNRETNYQEVVFREKVEKITLEFLQICNLIILLLSFIELNIEGMRKILKKHDKLVMRDIIPGNFLSTRLSHFSTSYLSELFEQDGLHSILSSLRVILKEFPIIYEKYPPMLASISQKVLDSEPITNDNNNHNIKLEMEGNDSIVVESILLATLTGRLQEISDYRANIHQTPSFTHYLSLKPLIFDSYELQHEGKKRLSIYRPSDSKYAKISNFLNVLNTFLWTTNYYITVPTTNIYTEKLGLNTAYTGAILGAAPVAQFFLAFIYSSWSNYEFHNPLACSSLLQLVGNILYASALPCKSISLLILGRLLIGAGGAESVNRRYIADVIPLEERTSASVAFVTAGALGMAAGPAFASIFATVNISFWNGLIEVNEATAPAIFMSLLWIFYLISLVSFFVEPQRVGNMTKTESIPITDTYQSETNTTLFSKQKSTSTSSTSSDDPRERTVTTTSGSSINDTTLPDIELINKVDFQSPKTQEKGNKRSKSQRNSKAIRSTNSSNEELTPLNSSSHTQQSKITIKKYPNTVYNDKGENSNLLHEYHKGYNSINGDDTIVSRKSSHSTNRQKDKDADEHRNRSQSGQQGTLLARQTQKKGNVFSSFYRSLQRNNALILTFALYFLVELADELLLSSSGMITSFYFDWSISSVGVFMAILGLTVLPANYIVERCCEVYHHDDRSIVVAAEAITIIGTLIMVDWGHENYTKYQYVLGALLVFVGVAILEGVDTSLMSKLIPPQLSRGTFNVGLIASQIATIAKATADGLISLFAVNVDELIDGLYVPLLTIGVLFLILTLRLYPKLKESI